MRTRTRLAAVIAIGAALASVAGCTARDTTATPTPGTSSAPIDLVTALPAATSEVEEITWALVEGEPRSLVPGADYNFVQPNVCDSLLRVEPDFTLSPGIAEQADWTDPVTFVIDIRPGVTFWDGSAVTTEDVIYSLERHRSDITSAYYGAFVLVESIEATSDSQVTIRFVAPDSTFRDAISGGAGPSSASKSASSRVPRSAPPGVS